MPTTFADLTEQLRIGLGLTPQEARLLILRIVPTLQISELSEVSGATSGANAALGRVFPGAVGGQYSLGQLFNPADSGTILLLHQTIMGIDNTSWMVLVRNDTALPTLSTDKSWADFRRTGNPVGELREDTDAVFPVGAQLYEARQTQDLAYTFEFPQPLVLAAGQGLILAPGTINQTISASFFWTEERA